MSNCNDCLDLGLPQGIQGEQGPPGAAGTAGNDGAPGADGANILSNPLNYIGTTLAVAPQTLRTFTVTPAMLPNNGDEIIISGYLSSFITSVTGGFGVQYGAAFMFTWSGITGSAGVSQQYYFELTIRRNSAAQVLASAMIETGVNDATNWGSLQKRKWTTAAVDLTINNTLSLAVDSGTGAFNADEMVSRTFKITQLLS